MNVDDFKAKFFEIEIEAKSLAGEINNTNYLTMFNIFLGALSVLVDFVREDLCIKVLDSYNCKSDEDKDTCPLDVLGKNVLQKLTAIDPFLKKEIFDFLRPENNQFSARVVYSNAHNSQELNSLALRFCYEWQNCFERTYSSLCAAIKRRASDRSSLTAA